MLIEPGQVAVVTGAAQGIGRALAAELGGRGASVALVDLHEGGVRQTAGELGDTAVPFVADVTDGDAVASVAERLLARFGRLDLVVNNAGVAPNDGKPLWEADLADWRRVVEVNLFGVLHGIRAFVPHLVAAGRGHVLNIASLAGLTGTPLSASYGTSKHAVVALSETLRAEFELLGTPIGVTVACPAFVRTPMVERTREIVESPQWAEKLGDNAVAALDAIAET